MAILIVSFLLAVGAWADPQLPEPLQILQDYSEVVKFSDHGGKPDELLDQHILQAHQEHGDNSEIVKNNIENLPGINRIPEVSNYLNTECYHPFENVKDKCYFFSNEALTFSEAQEYCEIISHGHISQVSMVMLEHNDEEDLAILDAVSDRDTVYWIGASSNDSVNWNYVDGRVVDLTAPFWYNSEPNTAANKCVSTYFYTSGNFKKTYIAECKCTESLNFICQAGCPTDFKAIGKYCYMQSIDIGLPELTWPLARDYCQSMAVPVGYYSDLAVLGLQDQDTYQLLKTFVSADSLWAWVGASADSACAYHWTDERTIKTSSFYWYYNRPSCGSTQRVCLYFNSSYKTTWLYNRPETTAAPFVCQMFKNI